jgi:hypothetical protein
VDDDVCHRPAVSVIPTKVEESLIASTTAGEKNIKRRLDSARHDNGREERRDVTETAKQLGVTIVINSLMRDSSLRYYPTHRYSISISRTRFCWRMIST